MAIGIKKVDRNITLTLWERMYAPEIIRGLYITMRHFAVNLWGLALEALGRRDKRKIMTVYYPEETLTPPPAYRGRPVLVRAENGLEKCVACGLCEVACPPKCIKITGGERENGDRYPLTYVLDGGRCIFCGFCEEVCPKDAIVMSAEWRELCEYDRARMVYQKEALLYPQRNLQKRINLIRSRYFGVSRYRGKA